MPQETKEEYRSLKVEKDEIQKEYDIIKKKLRDNE